MLQASRRSVRGVDPDGAAAVAPDEADRAGGIPHHADVWFVHNDWPRWCDLTAADLAGTRRKVVVDGRRILKREAIVGVELFVLGG
ncbi:MAG: hypothetical protein AABX97_07535 [Candidatus Thermoplasmatota archaeon]